MKQFMEEVFEAVRNEIPEMLRDEIQVEIREVVKTNDEVLHGISIAIPGRNCMPTIYLEDCYEDYKTGKSVDTIAKGIIATSIEAYIQAPALDEMSLEYDEIKDKVIVQLVDAEINKERLKEVVYKPIENGYVLVPFIVVKEDDRGSMRAAISKEMAKDFDYDMDILMEKAVANTVERYAPIFMGMTAMFGLKYSPEMMNPMREDFEIDQHLGMYILSNTKQSEGATALIYPDVTKRIGDILGDNYYVLPSSLHEVIIVPESTNLTLNELQKMVKEANRTVVENSDILSDRVLYFDREKEKLIEPKARERESVERSER